MEIREYLKIKREEIDKSTTSLPFYECILAGNIVAAKHRSCSLASQVMYIMLISWARRDCVEFWT